MEKELNSSRTICQSENSSLILCNDTLAEVEEETSIQIYVVVTILSIFCVVGIIGNATSFYIYFKRRDKSTSIIFILALAGTDFLTCLIIIPYTIVFELLEYKLVYDILCKLYLFLITSNIPFSAYIMTAIAFDRYFCICHPFFHAFTVKRAKIIVWCLAGLAFTFGVITSLSYGTYAPKILLEEEMPMIDTNETEDILTASAEGFVILSNETIADEVVYYGFCIQNGLLIDIRIINDYYQKVYTTSFIIAFIIVVVLYCMIYRSILMRRAKKAKRKKKNNYTSVAIDDKSEAKNFTTSTLTTSLNGSSTPKLHEKSKEPKSKRPSTTKDTTLYANIKTAMMLFVVTIVFVIAFLPSFLMALNYLPFNMIVFYMYFSYNVANPIIYAFMNQTFRDDLKNIVKICRK